MKLIGLFKTGSGSTHAVIEPGKTVCGRKVEIEKNKLSHAGRDHVTCQRCLKVIPLGYY